MNFDLRFIAIDCMALGRQLLKARPLNTEKERTRREDTSTTTNFYVGPIDDDENSQTAESFLKRGSNDRWFSSYLEDGRLREEPGRAEGRRITTGV